MATFRGDLNKMYALQNQIYSNHDDKKELS